MNKSKQTFIIDADDKTKRAFKSVKKGFKGTTASVKGLKVALSGLALGIVASKTLAANKEVINLANSLDISVTSLGQWNYAAETVGISSEKMGDIFKDVQDKIGDFATTGGGAAADMFEALNLNIEDFVGLSPDKQLEKIGKALQSVESQEQRTFFMEALAGDASRLLPILDDTTGELARMKQEALDLGYALTEADAAKLEAANKALKKSQMGIEGIANQITVELAPFLQALSESFAGLSKDGVDWGENTATAITWATKGIGVMADGLRGLEVAFYAVKGTGQLAFGGLLFVLDTWLEGIASAGNAIKQGLIVPMRVLISTGNALGVVSDEVVDKFIEIDLYRFQAPESLKKGMEWAFEGAEESYSKMQEKLMAPLPSEGINKWAEDVKSRAQELGESIQANVKDPMKKVGLVTSGEDSGDTKSNDRITKASQDRALRLAIEEEESSRLSELRANRHAQELSELQGHYGQVRGLKILQFDLEKQAEMERWEAEKERRVFKLEEELALIGEDEIARRELLNNYAIEQQSAKSLHEDAITDIERKAAKERERIKVAEEKAKQDAMKVGMQASLQALQQFGPQLFGKNKKMAKAQALISTWSSVQQSWDNAGGYPWGIVPAGLALAAGLKNIKNIDKTNLGGGGVGGAGGGIGGGGRSAPSTSMNPQAGYNQLTSGGSQFGRTSKEAQPMVNITIAGDIHGNDGARIVDEIRTAVNEGDLELISADSRNGQDLISAAGGT